MLFKILLSLFLLTASTISWAGLPRFIPIQEPEAGIGPWQEMPFGRMRVLSCSTGVKDLSMVVGGLQVQLAPDWVMHKPDLRPLSDKNLGWLETPMAVGDGQNPRYQGEVLFPFVYARSPAETTDFDLGVEGDFPVCQGQKCMTLPLKMVLTLKPDTADYTAACPYLIERQRLAPLPAKAMGVKGFAWEQGDTLQMAFLGVNQATIAFLKTTQSAPFQVLETQLEKTGVLMRVKTTPWPLGQGQDWILITNQGGIKVPVQMTKSPPSLPPAPVSVSVWFLGWELFFLTPLFIWWGLGCARTNKAWKKEIAWVMMLFPVFLILRGALGFFVPLDWAYYGIAFLTIICLFPPVQKAAAFGALLIWPYFPVLPEMKPLSLLMWGLVMTLEVMAPFVLLYAKAADIGHLLRDLKKKNFFLYNLIFLMPTLILLGGFILQIGPEKTVFYEELNPNGLSVVCPQKEQRAWKKKAHLIAPDSVLGDSLQKMYGREKVVIWQDKKGRLILAPDISPQKAREAILNWQKYHAVNTP
ncbi:MAG: hypothetical protein ACI4OR_04900 [Alphaproteobacteria bacterium]